MFKFQTIVLHFWQHFVIILFTLFKTKTEFGIKQIFWNEIYMLI